jgi:MFS family permease
MTTAAPKSAPALPASALSASGQTTRWMVPLLILVIGAFMAILDTSIVNVAIPDMINIFGVDQTRIEWVSTAYTLVLGVVTPLSGWLGGRLGLRQMYLIALVICAPFHGASTV